MIPSSVSGASSTPGETPSRPARRPTAPKTNSCSGPAWSFADVKVAYQWGENMRSPIRVK